MYINTYIIPIAAEQKGAYLALAEIFADIAKEYGALEIFENWEVDIPDGQQTDYRRAVAATSDEKIIVSWVIWPDRESADVAHKNIFSDQRLAHIKSMPFDGKRMILGGFEPMLAWRRDQD